MRRRRAGRTSRNFFFDWYPVFGVVFMACLLLVFLTLLRGTIGSTKPETVKASKTKPVLWEEVQGVDAAKDELMDVAAWLKRTGPLRGARRPGPARRPPLRPARDRQDDARPRRRRPGRRRLLLRLRLELRRDVRRPRRRPHPPPLQGGAQVRPRGDLHRRARRDRRLPLRAAAATAAPASASRRSTSCWSSSTASSATPGTVIVIAASNHVDKLDHALLRPGRFDRQVLVSAARPRRPRGDPPRPRQGQAARRRPRPRATSPARRPG